MIKHLYMTEVQTLHRARGVRGLRRPRRREELFADMMAEREDIAAKRAACQAALRALREAQATIETLPQARPPA